MCGIAGYQGDFEPALLSRMSAAIAHRGPDGEGAVVFASDGARAPVGLAHRRLAILDTGPDAAQPMGAACPACRSAGIRDLALSYNGEIYDFRELRAELVAKGHVFRSTGDTEVLLHLYGEEGPEMLARLNGIFAFAIHDARPTGRPPGLRPGDLFLARDPLGVKPLYYAELDGGFLFASEMKALVLEPSLPRTLDPVALHQHLAFIFTPAPRTLLQAVRKLPPASALVVRGGRIARQWRYFRPPYGEPRLEGSPAQITARLHDEVEAAVRRQLVADVPVGAFLSGGLDSSSVVAMMRRAEPERRPVCYTVDLGGASRVDGNPVDLPYARRVAAHLGVELRTVEVAPDVVGELKRLLYTLDEPQADLAPINALLIAERARADGIPVLLSGAGGDDVFSGYRRHQALMLERSWGWWPRGLRAAVARPARALAGGRGRGMRATWVRRALKACSAMDLDPDARLVSYLWWGEEALRRSLYGRDFAAAVEDEDVAWPMLETLRGIPGERDRLNRMLWLETEHFLADHNLNYTDKTGMAAGVEVRVPLLDLELVRMAARIPPGLKHRRGVGKLALKRAMAGELPSEVIHRPKTGFGAPLRRWLHDDLRALVDDVLSPAAVASRGLFDPAAVRRLVRWEREGRVDGAYTVLALLCLELWCGMFVDATPNRTDRAPSLQGAGA